MSRVEDAVAEYIAAGAYVRMYVFPRVRGKQKISESRATALMESGRVDPDDVLHNLEISRQVVAMHDAHRIKVEKLLSTLRPIAPVDAKAKPVRPKLQVVR